MISNKEGNIMLKKTFIVFVLLITSVFIINSTKTYAAETTPDTLVLHYYRYAADYDDGWNAWIWPENGNGLSLPFDSDESGLIYDDWGVTITIDLTEAAFEDVTQVGIIFRQSEWIKKDVDKDRYIQIPETVEGGTVNAYFVEGDERIGYSVDDPNGPDKTDKIKSAYFTSSNEIQFALTSIVPTGNITLKIDDVEVSVTNITLSGVSGVMTIPSSVDLSKSYVLYVDFSGNLKDYTVTFDGIYDTVAFETAYAYDGDDLGAIVEDNATTFRLWAPISSQVVLNLYSSGTPASLVSKDSTATDTPTESIPMVKDVKGTWLLTVDENLHGTYYTFSVTNGIFTNEVVDPYAKSTGVNGVRGMIVDFSQTNPEGFTYDTRPDTITNYTDSVIYELHVRDLTSHSSWVVDNQYEAYRGKFMGFTVNGTTYEGVTTGIDHIIELGVTHVQLLPFFDYGSAVDESGSDSQFNWGYMPLNFNALEGYYSTNPYDGSVRINEFKQLMQTMNENDLRVVMDVVYNHTGQSGDSNFNLILPGYYFRMNADGTFSNGSGTGNETASERYMMQKFMVDSVSFWAEEYNISGFRFDLMALHDTETMNMIVDALHEIDSTILVYGEPWTGGTSPLDSNISANKVNLEDMPGVAAFNDEIRNGVKGSVFNASEGGFVQNNLTDTVVNQMKYGIVGGVDFPGIDTSLLSYQRAWGVDPSHVINYATAHDNNTLYDKLMLSTSFNQREFIPAMQKQANAIVLLAEGIPFIHAGAEFLRSKPCSIGTGTCDSNNRYDHNSYQSPDTTNQLRWDLKAQETNMEVFEYYKDIIALRLDHPAFRLSTAEEVLNCLDFYDTGNPTIIAYTLSSYANNDSWDKILVIHNTGDFASVSLPDGEWNLVANGSGTTGEVIKTYADGKTAIALENETLVLYQGIVHETASVLAVDGGTYTTSIGVYYAFSDGSATLNGSPYLSGTIIDKAGDYTLIYTDANSDITEIHFVIESSFTFPVWLIITLSVTVVAGATGVFFRKPLISFVRRVILKK